MLRDHVPNVRGVWMNAGECSFQRAIDFDPRVCHAFPHDIADPDRFRHDFGLCGPVRGKKRFLINEPLAKPCFASGVFRCQVSGIRMNHTMLHLPET